MSLRLSFYFFFHFILTSSNNVNVESNDATHKHTQQVVQTVDGQAALRRLMKL